ncbi:porin [Rheinheimera sp. 1928-s]|uniref:porin n=1 Tax=Rheinheimera sp. 1928-s TaxID=3033803 RepID=UPI00261F6FD6|nr:porin [Rheinheimera sp. 1928-s]MDF3124860.1 porin [Rheinheimera sp. 1928-s]
MNIKHYSAISCLLLLSHNTQAFEWDVYGKLDLQALYVDEGLYRYSDQGLQLEAPFTRLGFKASQDLTDNLKLIMVYEWQVNGLDDANKDHRLGSRNTYIGVAGGWGELVFGKNDTRFKKSEGKVDLFNETLNDIGQLTAGQDRLENVIGYQSPVINGFQWSATYQTGVSDEIAGGYDWTLSYGDASFKNYPYYIAYSQTHELNNLDAQRVLINGKIAELNNGKLSAGLLLQRTEHVTRNVEGDAIMAQLAYQLEAMTYKLQWQRDDSKLRHPETGTLVSAGLDFAWNKDLTVYTMISALDFESENDSSAALGFKYHF